MSRRRKDIHQSRRPENSLGRLASRGFIGLVLVGLLCGGGAVAEVVLKEPYVPSTGIAKILDGISKGLRGVGETSVDLGEAVGEVEPITADDMRQAAADVQEATLRERNKAFLSAAEQLQQLAEGLRNAAIDTDTQGQ